MGMFSSIFGSDEAGEAAGVRSAGAKEGAAEYGKYAQLARDTYGEAEKTSKGDIGGYYEKGAAMTDPYRQAGTTSLNSYMAALGLEGPEKQNKVVSAFQASPGYQFMMDQGIKAREASAAQKGQIGSGGLLKELTAYGQGLANNEYSGWLDRLQKQAEFGGQASQNQAQMAGQTGQVLGGVSERTGAQIGGSYTGQGEQAANAIISAAEANARGLEQQALANQMGSALGGDIFGTIGGMVGGAPGSKGSQIGGAIGSIGGMFT